MTIRYKILEFIEKNKSLLVFLMILGLIQFGIFLGEWLWGRRFKLVSEACQGSGVEFVVVREKFFSDDVTYFKPICLRKE